MKRGPASDLLRDAIRADMEARIEGVAVQLETCVTPLSDGEETARLLEAGLLEIHQVVVECLLARIRESVRVPG